MGKTLILTEKPSVARDFAQALNIPPRGQHFFEGQGIYITWALGHLLELADPASYDGKWKAWRLENLPIIPQSFSYRPQARTRSQLSAVLKLLKSKEVSTLIVATDAGREGELIARTLIVEAKFKKPAFRFWCSEALTPQVITRELKKITPLSHFDHLFAAAQSRQFADWLVGMNFTRAATLTLGELTTLGRVQTCILGLIVKRLREQQNFVPQSFFKLLGTVAAQGGEFSAHWFDPKVKEHPERIYEAKRAQDLSRKLANAKGIVSKLEQEKKVWPSPLLFNLTELQRQANIQFHFSAQDTLSIAQSLYEKYKCLSYPRTESMVLGTSSVDLAKSLVNKFKISHPELCSELDESKLSLKNRRLFNNQKLTDHHGLIPLKNLPDHAGPRERKIFELVLKRFLASVSLDALYDKTDVECLFLDEHFRKSSKTYRRLGHLLICGRPPEDGDTLPPLKIGDSVQLTQLEGEASETTPPASYTEASLLEALSHPARFVEETEYKNIFHQDIGIGTQATRAQMIETLLERKYIERQKKLLIPLEKGIRVITQLSQMKTASTLVEVKHTADWEVRLEKLSSGEGTSSEFLSDIQKMISKSVEDFRQLPSAPSSVAASTESTAPSSTPIGACPYCKGFLVEQSKVFSCQSTEGKSCGLVIFKVMAKKFISREIVKELLEKKHTKVISGFKSKAGKSFSASLKFNPNQEEKYRVLFDFEKKSFAKKPRGAKTYTKRVVKKGQSKTSRRGKTNSGHAQLKQQNESVTP